MSVSPSLYSHNLPLILLTLPLPPLASISHSHLRSIFHISSFFPSSAHCRRLIIALFYVVCILALLADQLTWIGNVSISKGAAVHSIHCVVHTNTTILFSCLPPSLSLFLSFSLPFSPLTFLLSLSSLCFPLYLSLYIYIYILYISYSPSFLGVTDITASFTGLHTVFIFLSSTTSNLKSLGVTLNTDFNTGTYVHKRHHKDYGYEATLRLKLIRNCD